ncbi:glucose-1-phosphate thymidylyltransferase RfbA [Pseudoalteromonas sp. G4]|uniref:glucose-1-phosphate thymidylyltransferase RfbA n=1 Tax=Pseudoalteromonas sp. G4 TaxID=2992761 RepID=UPI00237DCB28|nr:glucose-1-phosphate thymidylyltransferase RfbA [Pseudoalteromonas sp. G4]MDE3271240.1 glucose-1-phosphate thymidylyltransferase RfbA [Pseudoalteromonas sp. G4]
MKGIILAGGTGSRLYPLTAVLSKQLMPVYDKPMIYYPLATLMQAGIKDILIISTEQDLPSFKKLLNDGSQLGIKLSYQVQHEPKGLAHALIIAENFIKNDNFAMILGDNLFYGQTLPTNLLKAANRTSGCTIFGYHVAHPENYGVVEFDRAGIVKSIVEKPQQPKSHFAIPGIYFFDSQAVGFAKNVVLSERGELEIVDVLKQYLTKQELNVEIMGRGIAWLDTGTHADLLAASQFIETIDNRQGLKINCPEEQAFRNGWIDAAQLKAIAEPLMKSGYGAYLLNILQETDV